MTVSTQTERGAYVTDAPTRREGPPRCPDRGREDAQPPYVPGTSRHQPGLEEP